jgi:hypothetical protein
MKIAVIDIIIDIGIYTFVTFNQLLVLTKSILIDN